jgi:uncharacterized protein DUF6093
MFGAPSAMSRRLVRRYAEAHMNAQITILRGVLTALDPATGLVAGLTGAATVYQGKARIHEVSGGGSTDNSDAPDSTRTAVISIPIGAPIPHTDDLITVQGTNVDSDASESDADLDTRAWRITGVDGGTFFGDARRMSCTQTFNSRYWSPS